MIQQQTYDVLGPYIVQALQTNNEIPTIDASQVPELREEIAKMFGEQSDAWPKVYPIRAVDMDNFQPKIGFKFVTDTKQYPSDFSITVMDWLESKAAYGEHPAENTVTITNERYQQLLKAEDELNCLHHGGVTGWDWYYDSLVDHGHNDRFPED